MIKNKSFLSLFFSKIIKKNNKTRTLLSGNKIDKRMIEKVAIYNFYEDQYKDNPLYNPFFYIKFEKDSF